MVVVTTASQGLSLPSDLFYLHSVVAAAFPTVSWAMRVGGGGDLFLIRFYPGMSPTAPSVTRGGSPCKLGTASGLLKLEEVALYCSGGLCQKSTRFGHNHACVCVCVRARVCVPFLLSLPTPSHPSRLSQSTRLVLL